MTLEFGPRKVGIGVTDPSQVKVIGAVSGMPADLASPVVVDGEGRISFTVSEPGKYRVTTKSAYYSESITVDLLEDLPYSTDLQSKVDYLLNNQGSGPGGGVTSVNGKTGAVTLTAADVSAKPASYVPDWDDITGKPDTFGSVNSVNGKTGEVTLTSEDIEVTVDGESAGGNITQSLQGQANTINQFANDFSTALQDKLDIPTGTANSTTYARGDGTWATPPNTTYSVVSQTNIENPESTSSGLITGQRLAQGIAAQVVDEAGTVGLVKAVFLENGETPPGNLDPYTLVIELEA